MGRLKIKKIWDVTDLPPGDIHEYVMRMRNVIDNPTGNVLKDFRELRHLLRWVAPRYLMQDQLIKSLTAEVRAAEDDVEFVNANKPWEETEDRYLVEARAGGESILALSLTLGRSPSSVSTRLSDLIGVPRKTMRIEGKRIEGLLDGTRVEGKFSGSITR